MLSKKQIIKQKNYWMKNSAEKLKTMESLYKSKRYSDSLFFGHMILEMAMKANVVVVKKEHPPKTHNLIRLADLANLSLTEQERELLGKANDFNMHARYPDDKLNFYKLCTKPYTDKYFQSIITLYTRLCQLVKQKR